MSRDEYVTAARRLAEQAHGDVTTQGQRAVAWALLALEDTLHRLLDVLVTVPESSYVAAAARFRMNLEDGA